MGPRYLTTMTLIMQSFAHFFNIFISTLKLYHTVNFLLIPVSANYTSYYATVDWLRTNNFIAYSQSGVPFLLIESYRKILPSYHGYVIYSYTGIKTVPPQTLDEKRVLSTLACGY